MLCIWQWDICTYCVSTLHVKEAFRCNIKPKDLPPFKIHRKGNFQINPANMLKEWREYIDLSQLAMSVLMSEVYTTLRLHSHFNFSCFLHLLCPVAHIFHMGDLLTSWLFFLLTTLWYPSGEYTQQVSARYTCSQLLYPEEWNSKDLQNSSTDLFCTMPTSRNNNDTILSCNCTLLMTN